MCIDFPSVILKRMTRTRRTDTAPAFTKRTGMIKQMKNKINRTVFELWIGIIIFGLVCAIADIFVPDKLKYLVCLLIGVVTAIAAAYHMWWSIDRSLDKGEGGAAKDIRLQFVLRYFALIVVLGAVGIFFGEYVLGTFAGILGIKVAAYLQPLEKKLSNLVYGEEILPEKIEYLYDEDEKIKEPAKAQE